MSSSFEDLKRRFEGGEAPNHHGLLPPSPPAATLEDRRKAVVPLKPKQDSGTMSLGRRAGGRALAAVVTPPPVLVARPSQRESASSPSPSISPRPDPPPARPVSPRPAPVASAAEPAPVTPPPRPPKKKNELNSTREQQLEQKILELQQTHLQLVERLATFEKHALEELRSSGGGVGNGRETGQGSQKTGDLLSKLRGKKERNQKKKEARDALDATVDMDTEFWSPKGKGKLKLDMSKLEILHPLTRDVGGSLCRLFVCEIDGFCCVMKELDIAFARELNANLVKTFESEVVFLEQLPAHQNIVRYLGHTFDHEKGRARLFMTKYALSLRDEIVRRKAGIGNVTSGATWCSCCPKCAHVTSGPVSPVYFSLSEIARVMLDIAQGLYFLHFNQVLHRDLKSDNVFVKLGPEGEIVRLLIGDFDTAKNMKELSNRHSTAGTPGYIAPEVWKREDGNVMYTYAADIYSFGILMFETLCFRRPFEGSRGIAIQEQLLDSKKTFQDLTRDFTKAQIDEYHPMLQLFSQCCTVEPGERATISFIIMSLKNIIAQCGGGSLSPRSPTQRPRAGTVK